MISSEPRGPSTYLTEDGKLCAVVRNAFDAGEIRRTAEGGTAVSASGSEYDAGMMLRMLVSAARYGPETDISYLEGRMIAEILRESGALSPESAVPAEDTGFRRIPPSMLRGSGERAVFTEDGRIYLKRVRDIPERKRRSPDLNRCGRRS